MKPVVMLPLLMATLSPAVAQDAADQTPVLKTFQASYAECKAQSIKLNSTGLKYGKGTCTLYRELPLQPAEDDVPPEDDPNFVPPGGPDDGAATGDELAPPS